MIEYTLIRSKRRSLGLQIDTTGSLIVRAPIRMSISLIEEFIQKKGDWVEKHQKNIRAKNILRPQKIYSDDDINNMKKELYRYMVPRVEKLWNNSGLPRYRSIKITRSNKRWGSCSGRNGLCFSYRLFRFIDEDPRIIDAIIYHELAHLKEKNHSRKFWDIVFGFIPDYKAIIKNL